MSNDPDSRSSPQKCCRWGLYIILDAACAGKPHIELTRQVLAGGARVIQLRDKSASFEELIEVGSELRRLTREAGATFIVNDNPYLAREVDADGLHIGQGDVSPFIARDILGPNRILGLSTHNQDQVVAARAEPVDYIGVGPVFETTSKQSEWPVVGTDLVAWVKRVTDLPVVAIGGITRERVADVVRAGADNIAVIREVMAAPDITERTRELQELIECSRQNSES